MKKEQLEIQLKVGLFVAIGVGLTMLSIILIGGPNLFFSSQSRYHAYFPNAMGLISGAKVVLDGIQVGTIEDIQIDRNRKKIKVGFLISSKYSKWIYKETVAEILTQGVLGDKFIALKNEEIETTSVLPEGSEIPSSVGGGLSEMLSDSGQLISQLNKVSGSLARILKNFEEGRRDEIFFQSLTKATKNIASITSSLDGELKDIKVKSAIGHLNSILKKIDQGKGTVGALINDPALYDDVKALIGQANRNRVVRNLVRQTIKEADEASTEKTSAPAE